MLSDSIVRIGLREELFLSPSHPFANNYDFANNDHISDEIISIIPSVFENNLLKANDFCNVVPFAHLAWWFFGLLLSCIIFVLLFNMIFKNLIRDAFKQLMAIDKMSMRGSKKAIQIAIFFVFSVLIGLFFVISDSYIDIAGKDITFLIFCIFSGSVLLFMLFKLIMTKLIGYITKSQNIYEVLIDCTYSNLLVSSIIIMVILSILSSGINITLFKVTLISTCSIIVILYLMKLCKFFYVSLISKDGSIVNLFLYLCIVEIIPILYSVGVANMLISRWLVEI